MTESIQVSPLLIPELDPEFVPAALWNRAYQQKVNESGEAKPFALAVERNDGSISVTRTKILPHQGSLKDLNQIYTERLLKFLLWQKGGHRIVVAGEPSLTDYLRSVYSPTGARAFDYEFIGERIYGKSLTFENVPLDEVPETRESSRELGRHLNGCRIGFDLGGSDRKCAAVIDGEVIHSEEVVWDPYFATDPQYHYDGINDSIRRAAAKLPRVDAIGGSAAGVYVDNEVRVASIFRGIPDDLFKTRVRRIFFELQKEWGNVPFVVVNDGEVTALAGSMALEDNAVLGVAMGTSLAAGYVTPEGGITNWLNELAFVPVDYRPDAPRDEWSGDIGVGAQYFSQQAIGRLLPRAGIDYPPDMGLPEKLVLVQELMEKEDPRARKIYETIGTYFGYNLAHYADYYSLKNVLVLGRVMSGTGGEILLKRAQEVINKEFPELASRVRLVTPGEKEKRHGQAVAAASLPALENDREQKKERSA
ncbi:MAG TPA: ROK family protein [Acidobacteriota bacterium]|nr:ROK family protein [Acidobacteriota bacterium]